MFLTYTLLTALVLDYTFAEPQRAHPLGFFGRYANYLELKLLADNDHPAKQRLRGYCAVILAIAPGLLLLTLFYDSVLPAWLLSPLILYLCIAPKSLEQHALAVYNSLQAEDLDSAKLGVAQIVSRETKDMDYIAIRKAVLESTLENGADAVFAPLFWFLVCGPAGAVSYRLVNTLDAMWGYKNPHYYQYGWTAAKLDDALNWIPARLTALTYLLLGHSQLAWQCWRAQAPLCDSPNAGPVMASGAGALNICLGGDAIYHGQLKQKPLLGSDNSATNQDVLRAISLIKHSLLLWLLMLVFTELYLV